MKYYLPIVAMQAPKNMSSNPMPRALQACHRHRVVTLPLTTCCDLIGACVSDKSMFSLINIVHCFIYIVSYSVVNMLVNMVKMHFNNVYMFVYENVKACFISLYLFYFTVVSSINRSV